MGPFCLKKSKIPMTANNRWVIIKIGKLMSTIDLNVSLKVWRFDIRNEMRKMQNILLDLLWTFWIDINLNKPMDLKNY